MPPLETSTNVAARMGRWSARHRKTAIASWLAFVVAAVVIGAALGTKKLDPALNGVGESKHAQQMIATAALGHSAAESVLVTSSAHKASDPAFRRVLAEVDVVTINDGEDDECEPAEDRRLATTCAPAAHAGCDVRAALQRGHLCS